MSRFVDLLPDDNGKSCVDIRFNNPSNRKIKSNNYQFLLVRRLIKILVLFFFGHLTLNRKIQYHKNWTFLFCLSIVKE